MCIRDRVIQNAVKILNEAKADTTVADAFKEIFADKAEEEMPKIQLHKLDGTVEEEAVDLSAVSYTHLDVYKRQHLCSGAYRRYGHRRRPGQASELVASYGNKSQRFQKGSAGKYRRRDQK